MDTIKICTVCKLSVSSEGYCSDYCAYATPEEIKEFLSIRPGKVCSCPCAECGASLFTEWNGVNTLCKRCNDKVRLINLLKETLQYLPLDLAGRVHAIIEDLE